MAVASHLTPTYPLHIAGYTLPGYTAFYAVILNLALSAALTPLFNALSSRRTRLDETAALDYQA